MAEYLKKENLLHRDEAGNLILEETQVDFLPNQPIIKVLPIPRGKLLRLRSQGQTTRPNDEELLLEHVVLPKLTREELAEMTVRDINALIYAVLSVSTGFSQEQIRERTLKKVVDDAEEEVKKK